MKKYKSHLCKLIDDLKKDERSAPKMYDRLYKAVEKEPSEYYSKKMTLKNIKDIKKDELRHYALVRHMEKQYC